ncbi:fatty acid desaturase family protein [Alkalinema sp. FACHB-956]|uniref:fatty acid desaturase family protein n=1 Tax=Alkalinema sp. FACHB-956 TaxID=2692768 RepID=UPI0016862944|nr:fatty acid desaturase family protein [Alkalinema sp. FACHB-956]MBD2327059.1 fatty acid desaturase family protein [Alkalinema sp. FACHB-956]
MASQQEVNQPSPDPLLHPLSSAPPLTGPSAEPGEAEASFDRSAPAASAYLSPRQVFSPEGLEQLNQRSDLKGTLQLLYHLSILGTSGYLWLTHLQDPWIGIPALMAYGFSIAAMFAPLHECVHRTAFANSRVNDIVAWLAGLLSLYNSTFYRRYHKWHHRYTRIPGKDPELTDPTPNHLGEYLWQVSGIPWWMGKVQGHYRCAIGQMEDLPYIPATARSEVQRSVQLQLACYGLAIGLSIYFHSFAFVLGWVLPLAIGQPILRLILLAEHTGCTLDANPFTNTRTTLTWPPLRWLMWNMPFHAEHHFCPSLPFHALGQAHQQLRSQLQHVAPGYTAVNLNIIQNLGHLPQ